jgi:DNA polymerase I-like protein with 3'-5' exonuclease and polymerase domains/uracil-DNA glycosylase
MVIQARVAVSDIPLDGGNVAANYRRPIRGNMQAPILVLCDPPKLEAARDHLPMHAEGLRLIAKLALAAGLDKDDFLFLGLCPPMPVEALNSASRKWKHVQPHSDAIWERIREIAPRCIVTFGELASRIVMGSAVAITKARGRAVRHDDYLVLPMLSPGFVQRIPDHLPTFTNDWHTLARIKADGWTVREQVDANIVYEWREDISDIIAMHPRIIGVDTEGTGLRFHDPKVRVLTVQIAYDIGKVAVCPIDPEYWPAWKTNMRGRARLMAQIRTLVGDPTIKKVLHNGKFDQHMMRKAPLSCEFTIDHDTQLEAFAVDENMMEKSLDECTRRWVPALAGYADAFNQSVDKSRMIDVPPEVMLPYAGGDPDATLRLHYELTDLLDRDRAQLNCYQRIMMPAINCFADTVERTGMLIDQPRLREFGAEVTAWVETAYKELIGRVPAAVRLKHLNAKKELSFGRADFVKDILFTHDGFNLTPKVFTKTTRDLKNEAERIPSTSSKDHLPFFDDPATPVGQFVHDLIDFQKTSTLLNNFIGNETEGSGMWQYIAPNGKIYPSYMLHRAVTGRTASADPNGQNFPKRGRWAKAYQSIFKASPGFKLINCDLSQIELRIAAWMANERAMLQIYRNGGDIHAATGQYVAGLSDAQWAALTAKERKSHRQKAKAVNFGFLYGMGAKKFRAFAKTDYGVDYTEKESYETRERFFTLYSRLPDWHANMREQVKRDGQVRALHGAVRHLPSINSADEMIRSECERQAINSPVQRFGSDLGLMSMHRFSTQADPELFRIIGFVHDALVMEVRDGYEQEGVNALLWAMENNPLQDWFGITPPLPILAEADIGLHGGAMLEFADLPSVEDRPAWFNAMGFDRTQPAKPTWWDDNKEEEALQIFLTS